MTPRRPDVPTNQPTSQPPTSLHYITLHYITPPKPHPPGQAANAGLLAVRILGAAGRPDILNAMEVWLREQRDQVLAKAERLEGPGGWREYLGGGAGK